ncbi:MAG: tetratricopeptide repeat protein [Cyanobacteria bacterium P01_G01_bin.54]
MLLATLLGAPAQAQDKLDDFDYWASLCNTMLDAQLYEEALAACDQAVGLYPGDPEAWHDRGDVLAALERYAEALVSYEQTLRQSPTDSLVQAKRCGMLVALGRNEDAIISCEEGLEIDGEWGEGTPAIAWYNRGAALTQTQQVPEALDSYDWALRIDPTYSPALAGRCHSLALLARFESSLTACDQALQMDNWDGESPALGWLNRGRALVALARNPNLEQNYLIYAQPEAGDLPPPVGSLSCMDPARCVAEIYYEALESYNRALAIDPNNEYTWTEQGTVLGLLGRNTEALSSHDWALSLHDPETEAPFALALANKCNTLNRLGQYADALAACDEAIQKGDARWGTEGPAFAWNQRGNAFAGLFRYPEGLTSVNRAIALQPDYTEAWLNRSVLLWLDGRYAEAFLATQQAIELQPQSSRAWYNQGRVQVSLGNYTGAESAYRSALAGDVYLGGQPAEAEIQVNLSAALWRLGRYSEGLNAAEAALRLDPESRLGWANKALNLMSSGRYSAAVAAYEAAIALDALNPNLWLGLGISHRNLQNYPSAQAALQKVLELDAENVQAQTNLEAVMQAIAEQAAAAE